MPNGTVKFFNAAKGFGFITPDDNSKDVFVPATSVTAAGISVLLTGQRISFEAAPDTKGPKAIDLKVIAEAPPPPKKNPAPAPVSSPAVKQEFTVYLDAASPAADEVLAELDRSGLEIRIVDFMATPLTKEELKSLSLLLRDSNQSLVRKYDPLFLELRLDDRFISDGEFWGAIFEHPSLINGPILATATRAGICNSKAAVKAFLSAVSNGSPPVAKPKGLSAQLLQLVTGKVVTPAVPAAPPAPEPALAIPKVEKKLAATKAVVAAPLKATKPKAPAKAKAPAKTVVKAVPKSKPKERAKVKAPAKKVAPKPVKKTKR